MDSYPTTATRSKNSGVTEGNLEELNDDTLMFSNRVDFNPAEQEVLGDDWGEELPERIPRKVLEELRGWSCAETTHNGSLQLTISSPDMWRRFVGLTAQILTRAELVMNPSLSLAQRRVLANTFRGETLYYGPGGHTLPRCSGVRRVLKSDEIADLQLPATAPGTPLGHLVLSYPGGHVVERSLIQRPSPERSFFHSNL